MSIRWWVSLCSLNANDPDFALVGPIGMWTGIDFEPLPYAGRLSVVFRRLLFHNREQLVGPQPNWGSGL